MVSELHFKFLIEQRVIKNKVKMQNLVNRAVDRMISWRNERIYDSMSKAIYVWNMSSFLIHHIRHTRSPIALKFGAFKHMNRYTHDQEGQL